MPTVLASYSIPFHETACGRLGLLQQVVDGLDIGVATPIEHAAHRPTHVGLEGLGQALERLKAD